jgi:hypothetical protein
VKDDVYLVSERLNPLSPNQAQGIRKIIPTPPVGYEDFLCNFGTGTYCDELIVWAPRMVAEMLEELRPLLLDSIDMFRDYGPVPDLRYNEMIPIANSLNGDHFVVMPPDTTEIFMIPRHDDAVYSLPDGFLDLFNWKRSHHENEYGEAYGRSPDFRYFETDFNRASTDLFTAESFELHDIAYKLTNMLSDKEVRRIEEREAVFLFPRAIQEGRIQLTQSEGDQRVGVQISFDRDCSSVIASINQYLESIGFYVI